MYIHCDRLPYKFAIESFTPPLPVSTGKGGRMLKPRYVLLHTLKWFSAPWLRIGGAPAHLSLCGESPSESKESPYCRGCRWGSVKPQCAARLARASMHAGLLHLLVPTEDDIMPEGQSERTLSVRSRLHVLPSCLRKKDRKQDRKKAQLLTQWFSKCVFF